MSNKINNSTTDLLPLWRSLFEELDERIRILKRDVTTRWNSTHDMGKSVLAHKTKYNTITDARANKLTNYRLSTEEWEILEQLVEVLQVCVLSLTSLHLTDVTHASTKPFKDATLLFSESNAPNLADVIPAMDEIDHTLQTVSEGTGKYCVAIRVAAGLSRRTFNRYYEKSDMSHVYRIAMSTLLHGFVANAYVCFSLLVLHPGYMDQYWEAVEWPREWIDEAMRILYETLKEDYSERGPLPSGQETTKSSGEVQSQVSTLCTVHLLSSSHAVIYQASKNFAKAVARMKEGDVNQGEPLPLTHAEVVRAQVKRYLTSERSEVVDPIQWWYANASDYPDLWRAAVDYLSIPGESMAISLCVCTCQPNVSNITATSTDVERVFSHGRVLITYLRNRLTPESMRALFCLGAWLRAGLVDREDLQEVAGMDDVIDAILDGEEDTIMY